MNPSKVTERTRALTRVVQDAVLADPIAQDDAEGQMAVVGGAREQASALYGVNEGPGPSIRAKSAVTVFDGVPGPRLPMGHAESPCHDMSRAAKLHALRHPRTIESSRVGNSDTILSLPHIFKANYKLFLLLGLLGDGFGFIQRDRLSFNGPRGL
ncbi:unnamed protein product, partial [Iphiclides podalirius]